LHLRGKNTPPDVPGGGAEDEGKGGLGLLFLYLLNTSARLSYSRRGIPFPLSIAGLWPFWDGTAPEHTGVPTIRRSAPFVLGRPGTELWTGGAKIRER